MTGVKLTTFSEQADERAPRPLLQQYRSDADQNPTQNWDFKRVKKGTDYSRIDDTIPHTARLWFHVSLNQRSTDADVAGVLRHPDGPAKKVPRRGPKRPTKASRKGRRSASRASSDEDDDDDFEEEELDELDADHEEEERAEKEVVARTPSPFVAEPVEPPAPAAAPTSPDCARCEPHVYFSVDEEQPTDWTTTESFSDGVSHQYTHFGDQLPPTSSTFARAGAGQYDIVTSNSAYSFLPYTNSASFYETSQKAYAPYPSTFEHYASPRFYSTHSDTSQPSFHLPSSSPTAPTSPDHHHLSSQFLDTTLLPAPSQRHTSPIQRHPSSYYSAPLNPYTHPTYVSSISWPSTSHSSGELGTAAHAYVGPSQRRELSRSTTKGSLADASLGLSRNGSLRMMQDLWEQPRAFFLPSFVVVRN